MKTERLLKHMKSWQAEKGIIHIVKMKNVFNLRCKGCVSIRRLQKPVFKYVKFTCVYPNFKVVYSDVHHVLRQQAAHL